MAIEKRRKKAKSLELHIFFSQENDIQPFKSGVERILKGICGQSYILGFDTITGDSLHLEKSIRIYIKLPWPRCLIVWG